MLVALTILSLICCVSSERLLVEVSKKDTQKECISFILKKYFVEAGMLTLVDLHFNDDTLLKYVHSLNILGITISRFLPQWRFNRAYMFASENVELFIQSVNMFSKEGSLNPYVRFLVVIRSLQYENLEQIFNALLEHHIHNVVVFNATETAELYTYNPFEDYGCGKFYKRVIEYGKCYETESVNLYPVKTITGLRNCFLTVSCADWPPYTIKPSGSVDNIARMGVEPLILDIMSQIEHFKYKIVFDYDAEMFSVVSQSNKGINVSGPMTKLQANHADVMLGGLVLTQSRANIFFYVHGYLDQVEEIRLMVKKAPFTLPSRDFYIVFTPLVWSLLLLAFLCYALIMKLLLKPQDKGRLLLRLLDNLFLHGTKIKARQMVNAVFFCWVIFAYLINSFYQSLLVSRATMPSLEYQIDNENEMYASNLKPCVSEVMKTVMAYEESRLALFLANSTHDESCDKFFKSITAVSEANDKFTAILNSVYHYNRYKFYDEYGMSKVHSFSRPFTKVINAMFFYKGFPAGDSLYKLSLRIRETGISDKALERQTIYRNMKHHFHSREYETRFFIPWYVYIVGISISSLIFVVEIISVAKGKPNVLQAHRLPGAHSRHTRLKIPTQY